MELINQLQKILLRNTEKVINADNFQDFRGKSILITGMSGMIGVNIVACLYRLHRKYKYLNKVTGVVYHKLPEYFKFLEQWDINIMQGDLADSSFVNEIPKADIILHMATFAQPGVYLQNKVNTLKLNTKTLFDLFNKLNDNGKLLFLSSSSVYIGSQNIPFSEDQIGISNTNHPRSCYIEGKRCGEAICEAYRQNGIDAKSIRLSLAYGPGNKKGDKRVVYDFIKKGLLYKEIRLLDQGNAKRTYCYITDAVQMIFNILLKGQHSVYNVGGESDTTIAELAQTIGRKINVPVILPQDNVTSIKTMGAPPDDKLNLNRYYREFGKPNFTDLSCGLDESIQWQKVIFESNNDIQYV